MRIITAVTLALFLVGCASFPEVRDLDSGAYTKCAVADVATTGLALSTGLMHEGNPLVKALYIKALGPVAGIVVPAIGLSILGYYLLREINNPDLTGAVTVLSCAAAGSNAIGALAL